MINNVEYCVCCGKAIPEGSQYCIICGFKVKPKKTNNDRITKYTFTVEVETDNIIGTKEQIADALAEIGKVTFPKIVESVADTE